MEELHIGDRIEVLTSGMNKSGKSIFLCEKVLKVKNPDTNKNETAYVFRLLEGKFGDRVLTPGVSYTERHKSVEKNFEDGIVKILSPIEVEAKSKQKTTKKSTRLPESAKEEKQKTNKKLKSVQIVPEVKKPEIKKSVLNTKPKKSPKYDYDGGGAGIIEVNKWI